MLTNSLIGSLSRLECRQRNLVVGWSASTARDRPSHWSRRTPGFVNNLLRGAQVPKTEVATEKGANSEYAATATTTTMAWPCNGLERIHASGIWRLFRAECTIRMICFDDPHSSMATAFFKILLLGYIRAK